MNNIIAAITEERKKQILNGLYLPKDRNTLSNSSITELASFYALNSYNAENKHLRRDQLIIAAALIIAELQRMEDLECELYCFVKYMP